MLFASGSLIAGPFEMRSTLGIDRGIRIFAVERTRSIYDSRCVPAVARPGTPLAVLTLLLAGEVDVRGGPLVTAPRMLVTSERWYDGPERAHFRAGGALYRAVELRVPVARLVTPLADEPVVLDLAPAVLAAVRAYAAKALDQRSIDLVGEASRLLAALDPVITGVRIHTPHPAAAKVWSYIARAYARLDTSPSLKRLALTSELSLRQAARYVRDLQSELLFPTLGWRDTLCALRLKLASLLLSCEQISIGDVAALVGYGHAEAMANALQRVGLGSPSQVRRMLLEGTGGA